MFQEMALRNDQSESLKGQEHNKGVKHLCEMGIIKVPKKYILPTLERPDNSITTELHDVTNLKLPVIDFAELHGPNHEQLITSLAHACQNYGFFQVSPSIHEHDSILLNQQLIKTTLWRI